MSSDDSTLATPGDSTLAPRRERPRAARGQPRTVYVKPRDETTWQAAEALAAEAGESLSSVVSEALAAHVRKAQLRAERQAKKGISE